MSYKDPFMDICSSFSRNTPKLETSETPINRWMIKQNVEYSYNILLVSNNKKLWFKQQHGLISKSKRNKSDIKEYVLYDSIYIKCKQIYRQKAYQWHTLGNEGGKECKGAKGIF